MGNISEKIKAAKDESKRKEEQHIRERNEKRKMETKRMSFFSKNDIIPIE